MPQDNNQELLPSKYVDKLFDTVKDSSDHNTNAIKELTTAINGLALLLTAPPTHTEIHTKIKEHDAEIKLKDKEDNVETIKRFDSIDKKLESLTGKMKLVIITISIVFSLLTISYIVVKSITDYQITANINKNTELVMDKNIKERNPILYDLNTKIDNIQTEIDKYIRENKGK